MTAFSGAVFGCSVEPVTLLILQRIKITKDSFHYTADVTLNCQFITIRLFLYDTIYSADLPANLFHRLLSCRSTTKAGSYMQGLVECIFDK